MKTDKNNCCNDPTLVESRQRSQNDMTERPYVFTADVLYKQMIKQRPSKVLQRKRRNDFVKSSLYPLPQQSRTEWELHVKK